MSNREITSTSRTIHPRALAALGEEACVVMLGVARDLLDGTIPPEEYDQRDWCGTACCIGGHVANRLGIDYYDLWDKPRRRGLGGGLVFTTNSLFGMPGIIGNQVNPTPALAARAIYRYVYEGAEEPWGK